MKGIILAGGRGTRLYPMTKVVSKQLLPIYDKPMIYYPLSVLMLCGIKEILIISTPNDIDNYKQLLGDGRELGMNFSFVVQDEPNGLAEAFILGESFIGNDNVSLILGDNVFYGQNFSSVLKSGSNLKSGAMILAYPVKNPSDFGIVEFDDENNVISLEEKPRNPKSKFAIPGLYFYDNEVINIAKNIEPSSRGELEITSVNEEYLRRGQLKVTQLGRGLAWLDTGTPGGLKQATEYIETIQTRQGLYIACIEEIAWRQGFISKDHLNELGRKLEMTEYGKYILSL